MNTCVQLINQNEAEAGHNLTHSSEQFWTISNTAKQKWTFIFFRMQIHLLMFASHWTASSEAEWNLDKPPSNFVKGALLDNVKHRLGLTTGAQVRVY